jgi:hypothetical protein
MSVTDADLAKPFGVRIVRNWCQRAPVAGPNQTEWSPLGGAYLSPDTLPLVSWDAAAPVVQMVQVWDPAKLQFHPRVVVQNKTDKAIDVVAAIKSVPRNSAPRDESKPLSVAPGQSADYEMVGGSLPREDVTTSIRVTSPDGAAVYYQRDYIVKLEQPDELWVLDADAAKKVDVSFAYFPYHDTIKTVVNINGLEEKERVTGITRACETRPTARRSPRPSSRDAGVRNGDGVEDPAAARGRISVRRRAGGLKIEPTVKDFVRHHFEWEHNQLGKSDAIVPASSRSRWMDRT